MTIYSFEGSVVGYVSGNTFYRPNGGIVGADSLSLADLVHKVHPSSRLMSFNERGGA